MYGKRAESLAQYLVKGQQVTVTGTLSEREYDGKKYQTLRVNDVALQGMAVLTAANRHSANQHRASKRRSRKAMAAGSMTWPMTCRSLTR